MTHVKHMGFELELAHLQITQTLSMLSDDDKINIINHLKPKALKLAVADTFWPDKDINE